MSNTATAAQRHSACASRYTPEELARLGINVQALLRARKAASGEALAAVRLQTAHALTQREFAHFPATSITTAQRLEYELTLVKAIVRDLAETIEALVMPVPEEAYQERRAGYDKDHFVEMVEADRRAGIES